MAFFNRCALPGLHSRPLLRRRIIWTSVAIGVVLTISALSTAGARAQGRGQ